MVYNETSSPQLLELYAYFDNTLRDLDNNKQKKKTINEMNMILHGHLSDEAEHSIYYNKLKVLLHPEIVNFCKEQLELKEDLNIFRMSVGQNMTEQEIKDYLDPLKAKYDIKDSKVGLEYHIETTRIDYAVIVFCVILRGNDIHIKKFVFRFRKNNILSGIDNLTVSQIPMEKLKGTSDDAKM